MFIQRLYNNIGAALKGEDYEKLENDRDRFLLHLSRKSDYRCDRRTGSPRFSG